MRTRHWMLLPLALGLPAAAPAALAPAPSAATRPAQDDAYQKLVDQFDEALREHERAIDRASVAERAKLEKKHPAGKYWSKFERLAKRGEARAWMWLLDHVEQKGFNTTQLRKQKDRLYRVLVEDHADHEGIHDVLKALRDEDAAFTESARIALFQKAAEASSLPAVKAHALYRVARIWEESDEDEQQAQGAELMQSLVRDYAKTHYGTVAASRLVTADDLQVGRPAPDFFGTTFEGHEFNLSDYKGKVVLLDFYGFW